MSSWETLEGGEQSWTPQASPGPGPGAQGGLWAHPRWRRQEGFSMKFRDRRRSWRRTSRLSREPGQQSCCSASWKRWRTSGSSVS